MPEPPATRIRPASGAADIDTIRTMFQEYQRFLGVDLCFQDFDAELAGLPGAYAHPTGALFLAEIDGQPMGCVGVRPCTYQSAKAQPAEAGTVAEMKRLYLRPEAQGQGLGRALAMETIVMARKAGYQRMWLDTLGQLTAAIGLYRDLGFREIPPYYDNPLGVVLYMELAL